MIEILVILAILGLIATIIIPNVSGFKRTGDLAAANTELQNVRTAATGYRSDHQVWPADSHWLSTYVNGSLTGFYVLDAESGRISSANGWPGLSFDSSSQSWKR
jgi:type II secretory pathway pseudopilin PulG